MKSCLGTLALAVTIFFIIVTVVYHTSINSELRFETRDSHVEYINTRRSYRPQNAAAPKPPAPPTHAPQLNLKDDDTAEEVAP